MKRPFFGGIHPNAKKEMSAKNTDFVAISPRQVVIPMAQHIGAPCKSLVNVGDKVLISRYSGTEVKLDGVEYTIVRQNDILAIVTD